MTERAARNPKYVAILAGVSAAILIVGALLRPTSDATTSAAPPPPSDTDLLRLARMSQRRSLDNITAYFSNVADGAARSLAFVPEADATGVVWSERTIVAPPIGLAPPSAATAIVTGVAYSARAQVDGPQLPLVALETADTGALTPLPRGEAPPQAGDWLLAVWQTASGRSFASGTFLETAPATCERLPVREILTSMMLTRTMSGGAIVDADGGLLAMVLPCDGRLAAVSPGDVDAMLEAGRSLEGRVLAAWGLRADRLTAEEAAFFKMADGVIVREVWNGLPADRAGLRPGDILRAIGEWRPIDTLESLQALVEADQAMLSVARGSRTLTVPLTRGAIASPDATNAAPPLGLLWPSPAPGYPIESVLAGSAAARAGIRRGDVLLRVDHVEPKTLAHVQRLLPDERSSPAFVELQRGDRRWGVLLP